MTVHADVVVPTLSLSADIELFESLGFQLQVIFPADEPRVAQLTGPGICVRLDSAADVAPPTIRLPDLDSAVRTSAGAELVPVLAEFESVELDDAYVFASGGDWGTGRAGMEYRDLIPDRHGGRVIASHIRIAEPGPVPDYVHHHDIRFQMIYCRRGRVEVIYEDQGDAFWMEAGDCVLQPPHIRHRVLASDGGCEVIEIASPAEHPTFVEHEIALPTSVIDPGRDFGGQRFCFDRGADLKWELVGDGWSQKRFSIEDATNGIASVRLVQANVAEVGSLGGEHHGDLCLLFALEGEASIAVGDVQQPLTANDSVAVPGQTPWRLSSASDDFAALHISLSSPS